MENVQMESLFFTPFQGCTNSCSRSPVATSPWGKLIPILMALDCPYCWELPKMNWLIMHSVPLNEAWHLKEGWALGWKNHTCSQRCAFFFFTAAAIRDTNRCSAEQTTCLFSTENFCCKMKIRLDYFLLLYMGASLKIFLVSAQLSVMISHK